MDCADWFKLSESELAERDIAEVNLAAAVGLPHTGDLDVCSECAKVDRLANVVRRATNRLLPKYRRAPRKYGGSPGRFRMLVLVTILQRDCGIRYNPVFSEGEYDGRDPRNLFIHGLLSEWGGTCVTMPVLYAAVGRRLGYPIKLALAKAHAFCRWEGRERFNIEATSLGFNVRSDEHYLKWPLPISAPELATGQYLRNLTPRQELAFMLEQRACCALDNLMLPQAVEGFSYASKLWPQRGDLHGMWGVALVIEGLLEIAGVPYFLSGAPPEKLQLPWQRRLYPSSCKELKRILRNHGSPILTDDDLCSREMVMANV